MYFSSNLRYLRKKAGFSQEFIANKFGYKSYTTIQKWETGVSEPSLSNLQTLATLFDISMTDFINIDLERTSDKDYILLKSSPPEQTLIKKYRKLDDLGRDNVNRTADHELERVESYEVKTIAAHSKKPLTKKQQDDLVAWQKMMRERGK